MSNFTNLQTVKRAVSIDDLHQGDVIFLSSKPDSQAYFVLDLGKPFILVENMKTHFANLYRPSVIYKEFTETTIPFNTEE